MSDPARLRGSARKAAVIASGALGVALAVTAGATLLTPPAPRPAASLSGPASAVSHGEGRLSSDPSRSAKALQARLRRLPKDHLAWASLGTAYVEQARITADPSYYAKAGEALERAARLAPADPAVLTGRAALAAGRHEFAEAVRLARLAVSANPHGAAAYGVLADAHTQLGDLRRAGNAVRRMVELRPGVASFTRASYDAELRGDHAEAVRMLEAALGDAFTADDVAHCRYRLGELALRSGDLQGAGRRYAEALASSPGYLPALAGQARVAAFDGRLGQAVDGYAAVVARLPLAQYVVEYGEVLVKLGRDPGPQWSLLAAQKSLMAAAGVRDDLTWAEFEADHGSPAEAVRHAEAEYARNPNAVAADALAWALHKAGESRRALGHAREATASGWRNALFLHHRAAIEKALGRDPARSSALAERYNPRFDPSLPALARMS
ncbi:hypothetical protein [Sphaerisporangium sp. TRM90804]|uniref:tetratricopeptide repeat protein n=1 Tax=Sphaerisporangium sp. TRM90804 TaxID=3031113 RepID=UPI00244CED70|nr:hypothetical protein [Sphaerisporangium sp. TRM90804]MDH2430056.1 hypothetical protein [Sphaerisporangium sp. TRM90804]